MSTARLHLVFVFAVGCATTSLAGWITADLRAQTPASAGPGLVHACAAADGVLRMAPANGGCPPGQQSLFFRKASQTAGQPAPPSKDTTDARIKALEQRIAALERDALTGTAHRVVAPFEVVDKSGNRVLVVGEDRTMRLYNAAGNDVVRLEANPDGGTLLTRNGTGLAAAIGTSGTEASFNVIEGTIKRTELGRNPDSGNYRVVFFPPAGAFQVAGFGESENHEGGTAFITDKSGTRGAAMWMTEHGGQFGISNGAKKTVATLTEGKTAGGLLEIMSSGGERMVVAGVQPGGFGVVQAGPASFMQAAGLGLPGSYIAGKAK